MSTNFGFSVPQDQVKDGVQNLPNGKYPFKLVAAERKASKNDAKNWYIEAQFEVMAGQFVGQKHREIYNVGHSSEQTKGYALSDIKRLAAAVGYTGPLSSMDPYIQKPFCGTIENTIKPADEEKGTPERKNCRIKTYEPAAAYQANPVPASATVTGSFAPPQPAAAAFTPPQPANQGPWPTAAAA